MFNGSNCDQKSQLSGILTEPINPRASEYQTWVLCNYLVYYMMQDIKDRGVYTEFNQWGGGPGGGGQIIKSCGIPGETNLFFSYKREESLAPPPP